MAFRILYAPLCTVNVLHSHFLDQGLIPFELLPGQDQEKAMTSYNFKGIFSLIPTAETQKRMARFRVKIKTSSRGFMLAVESEEDGANLKPRIKFPDNFRFTFGLYPKDEVFFNYTNQRLKPATDTPFHFSNLTDNLAGSTAMLTSEIKAFDSNETYKAGDLISDTIGGEARLLEAKSNIGKKAFDLSEWRIWPAELFNPGIDYLKGSIVIDNDVLYQAQDDHENGVDPAPGAPGSKWKAFTGNANALPLQFVSYRDRLAYPIMPKKLSIDISAQAIDKVRVRLRRVEAFDSNSGKQITNLDIETEDGNNFFNLDLDLSDYPAGKYRISVKKSGGGNPFFYDERFYLTDEFVSPRPLAIVELFHTTTPLNTWNNWNNFRLLDGNGHLTQPTFDIRFRHRSTFWKYSFTEEQSPIDPGQLVELTNKQYETNDLYPITRWYEEIRKFNDPGSDELLLPNPTPQFIYEHDEKIYSEIFINA